MIKILGYLIVLSFAITPARAAGPILEGCWLTANKKTRILCFGKMAPRPQTYLQIRQADLDAEASKYHRRQCYSPYRIIIAMMPEDDLQHIISGKSKNEELNANVQSDPRSLTPSYLLTLMDAYHPYLHETQGQIEEACDSIRDNWQKMHPDRFKMPIPTKRKMRQRLNPPPCHTKDKLTKGYPAGSWEEVQQDQSLLFSETAPGIMARAPLEKLEQALGLLQSTVGSGDVDVQADALKKIFGAINVDQFLRTEPRSYPTPPVGGATLSP